MSFLYIARLPKLFAQPEYFRLGEVFDLLKNELPDADSNRNFDAIHFDLIFEDAVTRSLLFFVNAPLQRPPDLCEDLFFMSLCYLFFPPRKAAHATREEPCHKFRSTVADHCFAANFPELRERTLEGELAIGITITAIIRVLSPVGVRAATLRVFAHRHSAAFTHFTHSHTIFIRFRRFSYEQR
jgi:hypothetical protein